MRTASESVRSAEKWPEEQREALKAGNGKTDKQLARELSAIGPRRTVKAVKSMRRFYAKPFVGRQPNDWPRVPGDVVAQSEKFRVRLLEAMLAEHRARRLG